MEMIVFYLITINKNVKEFGRSNYFNFRSYYWTYLFR